MRWARRLDNSIYNGVLTILVLTYTVILYLLDEDVTMKVMKHGHAVEAPALILTTYFLLDLIANLVCLGFKQAWR